MRVLVAPDKFRGSLTAPEAAAAMADGWRDAWPDATVIEHPVADGGEGSADAVCGALGGRWVEREVHDPLDRPILARYALATPPDGKCLTAFVECSAASGYLRVKPHERDVPRSSTFGTGELLAHALAHPEVAQVIVGLGGSATNDGGLGMATALGYSFLDAEGEPIPPFPHSLGRLATILPPLTRPWNLRPVVAACDVQNPLLGSQGATHIYGPQKGLTHSQIEWMEAGLCRLADVVAESLGSEFREHPGAGSAGGLGFGLLTFCAARMEPGFALVARLLALEESVASADLVLTGEGAADAQSLAGKTPFGVATMARCLGKPVILFAGTIPPADRSALREHFDAVHALTDTRADVETCMREAAAILRQTVRAAAMSWRRQWAASP